MRTPVKRMLETLGSTRPGAALLRAVAPVVDATALKLTGGRRTVAELIVPTLVLTTVGRHSGLPRSTPLVYVRNRENLAVAATNWGGAHHPAWSDNLLADPHATVTIDGEVVAVVARLATRQERDRLWPRFDAAYAGFPAYRRRARNRDIRVFILEAKAPPP